MGTMFDASGEGDVPLRLPRGLWRDVQRRARAHGMDGDELLRRALMRYLERQDGIPAAGAPRWPAGLDA